MELKLEMHGKKQKQQNWIGNKVFNLKKIIIFDEIQMILERKL